MRDGRSLDPTPWSFFLPIALAVLLGALVAGLILRAIDSASDGDEGRTTDAMQVQPAAKTDAPDAAQPSPEPVVAETAQVRRPQPAPQQAVPAASPPAAMGADQAAGSAAAHVASVPTLPGAMLARRDGAPEACINGTIALRNENGWQQRLENDAPVACVEAAAATH